MDKKIEDEFSTMVANLLQTEFCPDWDPRLLHGFMGIASEAGELLNKYKNSVEVGGKPFSRTDMLIELSDLLHYMQMIFGVLDSSISGVLKLNVHCPDTQFHDEDILSSCEYINPILLRGFMNCASEGGELLNRYKKFLFYHGEPFARDEMLTKLFVLLHAMQMILSELDSSIEEIVHVNMAKLGSRYTSYEYSHDAAITHHRDKEAERLAVDNVIRKFKQRREEK